ncbi:MAG: DUF3822 family protein [Niabella sp.]
MIFATDRSNKIILQEQFNITNGDAVIPEESYLAMQLGSDYFSYCIYNPDNKKLLQLKRYVFDNLSTDILDTILTKNPVLEGAFDKIITELDFDSSTLLPSEMSNGDATPLMYLENADQQDHVITEFLKDHQIANLYTVPYNVLTWMVQHFPSSGYMHTYSVKIKNISDFPEDGLLRLDVLKNRFSVIAFKGDRLLLAKSYTYASPADMVFYLLKICEVFGFSQELVTLQVSGLIDQDSKLYRELYDYFLHLSVKPASWEDQLSGCPAHYFTSLNELTTCELLQEV